MQVDYFLVNRSPTHQNNVSGFLMINYYLALIFGGTFANLIFSVPWLFNVLLFTYFVEVTC